MVERIMQYLRLAECKCTHNTLFVHSIVSNGHNHSKEVIKQMFPMFLNQFLDTTCTLCDNKLDAMAEPITLLLDSGDSSEAIHGNVCQACITVHADHMHDMHTPTLRAEINAFEQWQSARELVTA